ncbi:MAG: AsmA-like C-terminal region-containing protein [Candidatus Gastranaerophilaceae bacterium]|nr:AsmA-like C-terminal region-containing protein [Candidatus Gastranaerophilaceae bacterium]
MKKFFKILGIICCVILVAVYAGFLFVLPRVIDLSIYKADIQKLVKEQANLDLDYSNEKIVTTPLLGVGFKAENIKVSLPDKSTLFTSDGFKAVLSLPHILILSARVSGVDIENPVINAEIMKNGEDYKIVKHIENILNKRKEATFGEKQVINEESGFHFNPEWIRIVIPNVRLHNYKVLVKDFGSGHYLDLHGEKLIFGYFNGESIRIRTLAELFSDRNHNITANVDIDTFLPPPSPKLDEDDDRAEKIDIPFINPVKTYQTYDLKTNIDSKIRIRYYEGSGLTSYGYFNADNITLKLSKIQLPESYFRIKTVGKVANIDSNFYASNDENIMLLGKVNYSRHPKLDMSIKTSTIKFQQLLSLVEAYLQSVNIKNELNQFKAMGSLLVDCHIKTNFKKLKSNGYIKVQNGALKVRNLGEVISAANINVLLDNNILKIENSGLSVGNSKVDINGTIDEKSYMDINVNANGVPLTKLFSAFAPKDLRNSFNLKSGYFSTVLKIEGKMKKAVTNAKFKLSNFDFADKKNNLNIKNKELLSAFVFEAKKASLSGKVDNSDFKLIFPKTASVISIPKLNVEIQDRNINIMQNLLYFNEKSAIRYSGSVTDYLNLENIDFNAEGEITTPDLIKLIGREFKPYINAKGKIPVQMSLSGNNAKVSMLAKALSDENNYITPVDFKNLQNKKATIQATVDFKPNRIKIKNTGLYTRNYTIDENGQQVETLDKLVELDGTIEHNRINLMKLDIPHNMEGKIFVFPKSSFTLDGTKSYVFGSASSPLIRSNINIRNLIIPEIHSALKNLNIRVSGRELIFNIQDFMMRNSDISASGKYSLESSKNIVINDLRVNSKSVNLDDVTAVTNAIPRYLPQSSSASSSTQDIPVVIPNGLINFRRIVTGNIELTNTASQMLLRGNHLYLRHLLTNIFNGSVRGNIDVDLIKTLISVDLNGQDINIEKALLDAAGMKDAISGTTNFDAKLDINGAAKTQEEQIKGINGTVTFQAKDGQFGPFGKLENLILAENIRESQFFQTALGGVINSLSTIDTTHYNELKGLIVLKDGICAIDYISSKGNVMNLHILGNFDIVKNYADMKVRVKITSILSNLLGPLNAINPVNLMNSAASMNVVTAKAFSVFCETVPEDVFALLPSFDNKYVDTSATKFQLGVRGDASKPLTLIKSFKWLATQAQFDKASEFVNSIPDPIEGSTATTVEEVILEAKALEAAKEAEKKTLKYKVKHLFQKEKSEN